MKVSLFLFIGLVVSLSPVAAQEAKVRASIETKSDVWVGQRVTVVVELLAPGYFASAASFQLPDPSGMLLIPPTGSPLVSSEEIDGAPYTVQRHELSVFARRGGPQTIPPLTARFQFKRQPLDKETIAATLKTEPLTFVTKVPAGSEKLGAVISARNLTAVETWKPKPGKAKAGDAFTRTITFTAPDVPAMAFPPFQPGKIDGLGIYPKPPEVLDYSERGTLTGERRDTITYVCQRPGQFVIPASKLTWFDLDAQQLKTIDFPARTLEVAPNPAMAGAAPDSASRIFSLKWLIPAITALVALVGFAMAFRRPAVRRIARLAIDPFRPVHLSPLNPPPS